MIDIPLRNHVALVSRYLLDRSQLHAGLCANYGTRPAESVACVQVGIRQAKSCRDAHTRLFRDVVPDDLFRALDAEAYSVIGLSFGGRGAEIIKVTFEDVSRTVSQETGEMKILVKYLRTK